MKKNPDPLIVARLDTMKEQICSDVEYQGAYALMESGMESEPEYAIERAHIVLETVGLVPSSENDPEDVFPFSRRMTLDEVTEAVKQMLDAPESYYRRPGAYANAQRVMLRRILNLLTTDNWSVTKDGRIASESDLT